MNSEDVRVAVECIRSIASDDERAHGKEDELHKAVLTAIADGSAEDPAAMARIALSTKEIKFARWCA